MYFSIKRLEPYLLSKGAPYLTQLSIQTDTATKKPDEHCKQAFTASAVLPLKRLHLLHMPLPGLPIYQL